MTATITRDVPQQQLPVREIKDAAAGRWMEILQAVGGLPADVLNGHHHPCPKCGGTDRFRLLDIDKGAVRCNQCFATKCGDGFAAVQWSRGLSGFREAVTVVGRHLGFDIPEPEQTKSKRPFDKQARFDEQPDMAAVTAWLVVKTGIDAASAMRAGVRTGVWPATSRNPMRVILFPAVGKPDGKPTGWIMFRGDGQPFPATQDKDKSGKDRNLAGSKDGWVIVGAPEEWAAAETVWRVEGVGDALALAPSLPPGDIVFTNICGAKAGHTPIGLVAGKRVVSIGDADEPGQDGMFRFAGRALDVAADVRTVRLPFDVTPTGGKDVRDFVTGGGTAADLLALAVPFTVTDDRPEIEVTTDEYVVNGKALAALSGDPDLYQRAGLLVQTVADPTAAGDAADDDPTPTIEAVPSALVRERLTKAARFVTVIERGDSTFTQQSHPPKWCVEAIYQRGEYPGFRPLRGISTVPIIRRDGSLLTQPGYDKQSRIVYLPTGPQPNLPDNPTRGEVSAAVELLMELVADFPFARPEHRSAWLAALLSILARYAFSGPAPLFLIDANTAGSGKGKLATLIGTVIFGRPIPAKALPATDDEVRKTITAFALAARPAILIDNIGNGLGCPSLDAALTTDIWTDRILGRSELVTLPLSAVWLATGNNVSIVADTARRVCHIRLESPLERPEERTGFRFPNVEQHARDNRAAYLAAALTILRGWFVAGKPTRTLPSWGSYEGWSAVVRQAIVWTGLPDPFATREVLVNKSDREAGTLAAFIHGWAELAGDLDKEGGPQELTAGDILKRLDACPSQYRTLRTAVDELAAGRSGKPSPVSLGRRLGKLRGRVVAGMAIDGETYQGVSRWTVRSVAGEENLPLSPPYPPEAATDGNSRGVGGDCGVVLAISTRVGAHTQAHAREKSNWAEITPQSPPTPRNETQTNSYYMNGY